MIRLDLIPTPYYGANALVASVKGGTKALVVDPSGGVLDTIRATMDEVGASVSALLCTHGHPDHVWECAEVASWALDGPAPVYIPSPDRYRMDDPAAHIPLPVPHDLGSWRRPDDLRDMPSDAVELVEGIRLLMVPAPGHTQGSAFFLGHSAVEIYSGGRQLFASDDNVPWALSADVLFSGSVGRTDFPGGDDRQMLHSLRTLANVIDPATLLIPGHGPITTMRQECETNPYLRRARSIG